MATPCGSQDLGETPKECGVREVFEETWFEIKINRLLGIFSSLKYESDNYPWKGREYVHCLFMGQIIGGIGRTSDEASEIGWFFRDQLPPLSDGHEPRINFAFDFLDNGGGSGSEACSFCQGTGDPDLSVNPQKAVISLVNNRGTEYGTYIAVQNELVAAYNELRNREAKRLYGSTFVELEAEYNDPKTGDARKESLKEKIESIKDMIPQKLSEAEPK